MGSHEFFLPRLPIPAPDAHAHFVKACLDALPTASALHELAYVRKIGKGADGDVMLANATLVGGVQCEAAVKVIAVDTQEKLEAALAELLVLSSLAYPGVVGLKGFWFTQHPVGGGAPHDASFRFKPGELLIANASLGELAPLDEILEVWRSLPRDNHAVKTARMRQQSSRDSLSSAGSLRGSGRDFPQAPEAGSGRDLSPEGSGSWLQKFRQKFKRRHSYSDKVDQGSFASPSPSPRPPRSMDLQSPGHSSRSDGGALPWGYRLVLVMEHCSLGSVHQLPGHALRSQDRDFIVRGRLLRQIAGALSYLHEAGVLHLDLKPKNVFLDGADAGGEVALKIGDFGLARLAPGASSTGRVGGLGRLHEALRLRPEGYDAFKGTTGYAPPEVLQGDAPTAKADIYAFGLIAYQVATGATPWVGLHHAQVAFKVLSKGERPAWDQRAEDDVPPQIRALVERCWHQDPNERPTGAEVVAMLKSIRVPLPRSVPGRKSAALEADGLTQGRKDAGTAISLDGAQDSRRTVQSMQWAEEEEMLRAAYTAHNKAVISTT